MAVEMTTEMIGALGVGGAGGVTVIWKMIDKLKEQIARLEEKVANLEQESLRAHEDVNRQILKSEERAREADAAIEKHLGDLEGRVERNFDRLCQKLDAITSAITPASWATPPPPMGGGHPPQQPHFQPGGQQQQYPQGGGR